MTEMKVIKTENKRCICCMKVHDIKTVIVKDHVLFKEEEFDYPCCSQYCDITDEFFEEEWQMTENDIRKKDIYRRKVGLLTSEDILAIRKKYDISQMDLCKILSWGDKTITRYESHQVQDRAHDEVLRRIGNDPERFLELLNKAKDNLPVRAYEKYKTNANALCKAQDDEREWQRTLMEAVRQSPRTREEILAFIRGKMPRRTTG